MNYVVFSKMHKDTIAHYECQLNNTKEVESIQNVLNYIEGVLLLFNQLKLKLVLLLGQTSNIKKKIPLQMKTV